MNVGFEKLESQLRSLAPVPSRLDGDTMLYEAGRAAARRDTKHWQAASTTLAMALFVSLFFHIPFPTPQKPIAQQSAMHPDTRVPDVEFQPDPGFVKYLLLRQFVLRDGPDALPVMLESFDGREYPTPQPRDPGEWRKLLEETL